MNIDFNGKMGSGIKPLPIFYTQLLFAKDQTPDTFF
ncbi:hypothetical protein SAMN05421578_12150 [Paenibacillus macquariensis]|uniref:Uncharacterized protein n=1 Tax=Paenibacillus macquariensis TaxID=948756 RepID=A0ABY1KCE3_9BACL|nr:hypothetical protein SAMN05421578_12150 [Paenibacillus macquariensis]